MFLFLLVIAFALLAFMNLRSYFAVAEVRVPDVMAMNVNDAYALLDRLGLDVTIYPEDIAGAALDSVTSQNPAPFAVVREGRNISLGVHTPPEDTRVPILLGRTLEQATVALEELYLTVGSIDFEYSDKNEGVILAQRPESSTVIKTGSSVHLTVSRGTQIVKVSMPSVVGLNVNEAKQRLQALGFKRVESQVTQLSAEANNLVRDQSPPASRVVPVSSPVVLYYSASAENVIAVPNVIGQDVLSAQRTLLSSGLQPTWISQIDDPQKAQGVVDYRPKGYTLRGSPMVLVVNASQPVFLEAVPSGLPDATTTENTQATNNQLSNQITAPSQPSSVSEAPVLNTTAPAIVVTPTTTANTATPPPASSNDIFIPPSSPSTITLAPDQALVTPSTTPTPVPSASTPSSITLAPQAESVQTAPVNDAERIVPISFYPEQYSFLRDQEYNFTLLVDDARGQRELMNQILPVNYSLETTVTVFGDAELQILINGEFLLGWSP